jgi:uncharacterized membrane protein YkoI
MRPRPALLLALLLSLSFAAPPGQAAADERPSQDEILAAVRRGEMRPLAEIEALLQDRLPGKVIKVELERRRGMWVYEFKVLGAEGRRSDVYVDASTGDVLKVERK